MKYSELSENEKIIKREHSRKWRAEHPIEYKKQKKKSVLNHFSPTVYVYFDNKGIAQYVGRTNHPTTRKWHHKRTSPWWREDLILVSMNCIDEWQSMEYEGKWGSLYQPLYNIEGQRRSIYYKDVE